MSDPVFLEQLWRTLRPLLALRHTIIVCLSTGSGDGKYLAQMPRNPMPDLGQPFDDTFCSEYLSAVAKNSAVHDGAVVASRQTALQDYKISGWSMRMYPPSLSVLAEDNKGSAYNSCISMSAVDGIDAVCLISSGAVYIFQNGIACVSNDAL